MEQKSRRSRKQKLIAIITIVGIVLVGISVFFLLRPNEQAEEELVIEDHFVPPVTKFGLPVDSFLIEKETVGKNQNLSHILSNQGISLNLIDKIAKESVSVFDVRKLRSDKNYYLFSKGDTTKQLIYFVYEIDPVDYVVYRLDSLHIYKGKNPIERKINTATGIINSSLWNALTDRGQSPMLALHMADVYQWSIDFFGLQKGDKFRVLFEESYVDSTLIGITNIFACQFVHANSSYYAFQFEQDSVLSYFNEAGESLKKAFLKAPLQFSRISSHFSYSRKHPIRDITRPHLGVDYAAPAGTPVVSIGDGVVVKKTSGGDAGNYLQIKHNSVYSTAYMHLRGFAKGIAPGVRVRQGQEIGYVGSTGLSTGPHLDFRVYKNGTPINPLTVESPPVEPVNEQNMPQYTILKDSLMNALETIVFASMPAEAEQ